MTFQSIVAALPKGTYFQESKKYGGRTLYIGPNGDIIRLHTKYADWYSLGFSNGVFYVGVALRRKRADTVASEVSLECVPDCHDSFLGLLTWAVSVIPTATFQATERKKTAEDLLLELESIFPPLGLDGGISLGQALLDDDYESGDLEKMQKAYAMDITHNWQEVPDLHLESFCLYSYLDQKGWKYYLPAILRNILRNPLSSAAFDILMYLLPGESPKGKAAWRVNQTVIFLMLTAAQRQFVGKVLLYLKGLDPDWFDEHPIESSQIQEWLEV